MEWKEPVISNGQSNYRFGLRVLRSPSGAPTWVLQGETIFPSRTTDWVATENIPIPIGEWFDLEVFWHYGDESEGQIWAKVNRQLVAEYTGRTQHPTNPLGLDKWGIFKNYTSIDSWGGPTYQWIDDVEIWSDVPTS